MKPAGTMAMGTKKKKFNITFFLVNLAMFEYLNAHNLNIKFTVSKVPLEGTSFW